MKRLLALVLFCMASAVAVAQNNGDALEFVPGNSPADVNANFVSIINSHMSSDFVVGIIVRMTPYELYQLRQTYIQAGGSAAVLDNLVQVNSIHPNLFNKYLNATAANYNDLVPAQVPVNGLMPIVKQTVPMHVRAPSPTVDFTLQEIYLEYRTAPLGSLSVQGALYETAVFVGARLVPAYYVGSAIGTGIHYLIETYAPQLDDDIGGTIDQMIQQLQNALTDIQKGQFTNAAREAMGMPPMLNAGGNYGYATSGSGLLLAFTTSSGYIVILPGTGDDGNNGK